MTTSICIGILAWIFLSLPLGLLIGWHLKRVGRDYSSHSNPFGRRGR